jgi:GntR family transcriptional regulator of abcA and norABC
MLSIEWLPNKKDLLPLYQQIATYIKGKIHTGDWPVHTKLPPQREMARLFQVNRSTLTTALDELIADGLLQSKVGSGIWVANNTWSVFTANARSNWNTYVDSGICLPNFPAIQEINRSEFNPSMIRLGTGELSPELIPAALMKKVLEKLPHQITSFGYEEPKGLHFLREQISRYLQTFSIHASPASILIVSGALQALQLICLGLLPKKSTILLEKPSYLFSLQLFQSMDMQFSGLPLDAQGLQASALQYQKNRKNPAVLYTIPCFHNPSGILMSEKRRLEILTLCQQEQIPIIEDDVYRELWLDAPPPLPIKAMDKDGRVLYIGSLSKALSPGLRIGWIAGPETIIERLADVKMQNDYGSSSLSQWAAAEWLASGLYHNHLEDLRSHLKIRRQAALDALDKHFSDLATWQIPLGGFYIWLKLLHPVCMQKLFKLALAEGLLINPGNIYDYLSNQHLRLSYSYASLPELQNGLYRLSLLIRKTLRVF